MRYARKELPEKCCLVCAAPLTRKDFNGRLEDFGVFRRRKHCSLKCARANSRRSDVKPGTYFWRARQLRGPKCEACGTEKRLQAHHCDGNQTNNTPENIQTLCIHCHRAWHFALTNTGRPTAGRMPPLFPTP